MKSLQKFKEFFALTPPEEYEDEYEEAEPRHRRRDESAATGPYRPVSYGSVPSREESRQRFPREQHEGAGRVSAAVDPGLARPARPLTSAPTAVPQPPVRPVASDPRPISVRPEPRPPLVVADDPNPLAKITTVRPRSYGEAQTIGEQFREGVPVIMDLNDMSTTDAKRLVDFAAGLVFGLRGSFGKVATKVFLISPAGVDVSDDDYRRLAESGFHPVP